MDILLIAMCDRVERTAHRGITENTGLLLVGFRYSLQQQGKKVYQFKMSDSLPLSRIVEYVQIMEV